MEFKFDLQHHASVAPSAKNLLLGRGPVYFNRWVNGVPTFFRHMGNVEKFPFKSDIKTVEKKSYMDKSNGTYAQAVIEVGASGSITFNEVTPSNLALALYGDEAVINQAAKTVVDEVYTVTKGGAIHVPYLMVDPNSVVIKPPAETPAAVGPVTDFASAGSDGIVTASGTYTGTTSDVYQIKITNPNTAAGNVTGTTFRWRKGTTEAFSADVTATGSDQALAEGVSVKLDLTGSQNFVAGEIYSFTVTPTGGNYVKGVDFKVNEVQMRGGLIDIPMSSTMADKSQVKVSYEVPAGTYPAVSGSTAGLVEGTIMFLGDPSYGPTYNADFWHVTISPNGNLDMIGDDFAAFQLDFTCLNDAANHPDNPYSRMVEVKE